MFQSARPNSRAYIFFKGKPMRFEQGYIVNQPVVRPKYPLTPSFGQQQEMVVDITVKTDSGSYNFTGVPSSLDIADTFWNGESAVISDSREAMNAELMSTIQKSQDVIDSVPYNNDCITQCKQFMGQLNPEYADRLQYDEELNAMKTKVSAMSDKLDLLIERMSAKTE